jgi:hypothetical protein
MAGDFFEAKVSEYVRKFGGVGNFFGKVLSSFDFDWSLIRVSDMVVEISNREGFDCEVECDGFFEKRDCERVKKAVKEKKELVFEENGKKVFFVSDFWE